MASSSSPATARLAAARPFAGVRFELRRDVAADLRAAFNARRGAAEAEAFVKNRDKPGRLAPRRNDSTPQGAPPTASEDPRVAPRSVLAAARQTTNRNRTEVPSWLAQSGPRCAVWRRTPSFARRAFSQCATGPYAALLRFETAWLRPCGRRQRTPQGAQKRARHFAATDTLAQSRTCSLLRVLDESAVRHQWSAGLPTSTATTRRRGIR